MTSSDMITVSRHNDQKDPVPLNEIRNSVIDSVGKLGRKPDLFLIHNPFVPGMHGNHYHITMH